MMLIYSLGGGKMGTLSKIREIFENIIEKLYREGQLHGEKEKNKR